MTHFICVTGANGYCICSDSNEECACRVLEVPASVDVASCLDCDAKCERSCVACGCTASRACQPDGCSWVTEDLCSECV